MTKPYLVTPSDLKPARVRRSLAPIVAAAFLALAVVLSERAPDAPAPPVRLSETPKSAPLRVLPGPSRKAQAAYERAVDLYAKGRLQDSVAILEKLPDSPAAKRALSRIRAELSSQKR